MDDGVSIAATLYVPDGTPPAGGWPAIVFLHGLAGNRQQMNALVEGYGFTGGSYAILTFDARGHGESGGLVGIDGPREVADTRAIHDWLAARPDVSDTRIGAWGISYGGGAVFNSLVAGVPWAAVATVETWTDLYSALMPQGLVKSGLVAGLAGSIPPDRRDPSLDAVQAAAFAGNARRSEAVGRRTLEHHQARVRHDTRLHGPGAARLPVRDRPGRACLPAVAQQPEAAVRRPARPRPFLVPRGRHRGPHGDDTRVVQLLPAPADLRPVRGSTSRSLRRNGPGAPASEPAYPRRNQRVSRFRASRRSPAAARPSGRPRHSEATIEVFGTPTVKVSIGALGGWSRLVAVLTARTRKRSADRHQRRRRADETRRTERDDRFGEPGDLHPQGIAAHAHARVVVDRAGEREPPLSRSPDAAERSGAGRHRSTQASGLAHTGHEVIARVAAVAFVALALVASAGGATTADPGVTSSTVLLGGTVPLTGEAAAFGTVGPGAKAYFDYVNAKGGVNGRTIEYRYLDDAYNPAQTVQLTRRLVEQDKVFAIFNSVGTANNLAIRDYLNAQKVPQLWAADGSQSIGRSFVQYPWTMGFLMSYRGEGNVYGKTIVKSRPKAKIAVLYENTELGLDMLTGLTRSIAGKGPRVVAKQGYEFTGADVSAQVALLKASGADTLMLFATPKFFLNGIRAAHNLGWKPQVYIASVSIEPTIMGIARFNAPELTKGALSIAFVKNPNDPIWAKDKAVALYRTIMRKYAPSGKPTDVYNWYGMTVAWTMVETLRKAGKNLTRAGLLRSAQSLDTLANPFMLPGIRLKTSRTDYRPMEQVYLYRYDNKQWVKASGLLLARG